MMPQATNGSVVHAQKKLEQAREELQAAEERVREASLQAREQQVTVLLDQHPQIRTLRRKIKSTKADIHHNRLHQARKRGSLVVQKHTQEKTEKALVALQAAEKTLLEKISGLETEVVALRATIAQSVPPIVTQPATMPA